MRKIGLRETRFTRDTLEFHFMMHYHVFPPKLPLRDGAGGGGRGEKDAQGRGGHHVGVQHLFFGIT